MTLDPFAGRDIVAQPATGEGVERSLRVGARRPTRRAPCAPLGGEAGDDEAVLGLLEGDPPDDAAQLPEGSLGAVQVRAGGATLRAVRGPPRTGW